MVVKEDSKLDPTDDPTIDSHWANILLREAQRPKVEVLQYHYPEQISLYVDYAELIQYDPVFAGRLINDPSRYLKAGRQVLWALLVQGDEKLSEEEPGVHLRVTGMEREDLIPIRAIRATHLRHLLAFDGIIKRLSDVRPKMIVGAFQCKGCSAVTEVDQFTANLQEPFRCEGNDDTAGCQKTAAATRFVLDQRASHFADHQAMQVQEVHEDLQGRDQPQRISCSLTYDVTGKLRPGDRVRVVGILQGVPKVIANQRKTEFEIFIDVISLGHDEEGFRDRPLTTDELKKAIEFSSTPNLIKKLAGSMAPTIHGMEFEKEALVLQLFGGVEKKMPDGVRIRGDIHILLVGDPGTAKSQLLRFVSLLSPQAIYTSGKSTTAAGLTAAAVRDDFSGGQWTLEAGVLVLADRGTACIDELDKMSEQDRSAMHEAMEQQTISIAKAGIQATLMSRCAVLAAANPKGGRFDTNERILPQVDLPAPLFSRFDLIFPIFDEPDPSQDSLKATHIINTHFVGEYEASNRPYLDDFDEEEVNVMRAAINPEVDFKFLAQYVRHAKTIHPIMTKEAMNHIESNFVDLRGKSKEGRVTVTMRQLEAVIRMAEASARLRLAPRVEIEDAQLAVSQLYGFLTRVVSEGGNFDIDFVTTGVTQSKRMTRQKLTDIIRDNLIAGRRVFRSDLIRIGVEQGFDRASVEKYCDALSSTGDIYEGRDGIRLTHEPDIGKSGGADTSDGDPAEDQG